MDQKANSILKNLSPEQANNNLLNRKKALQKIINTGKNAIAASLVPVAAIGLSAQKASAQFEELEINRALNFILQVELMQEQYYITAITTDGFLSGNIRGIFGRILTHQKRHVVILKNNIFSSGLDQTPPLKFNFTAGGQFAPFSNLDDFLALAQIIEDTAVGFYKTQIETIFQQNAPARLKSIVFRLASTESRHAYLVRHLRSQRGFDNLKGWINRTSEQALPSSVQSVYANEDNTTHSEVNVPSITDVNVQAIQEAWDEPLGSAPLSDVFQLFGKRFNFGPS
jgi:rubrerythrin